MTRDLTRRTLFGAASGALTLSALAACSPRGGEGMGGPASTVTPTAQRASGLEAAFDKAFTASGLAGCAVRVRLPNGALWLRTAGVADLDTEEPYRAGDSVRIASITKTFTATAVLRMVDERMLALDDTLDRWYPQVPNASEITLEQMLGMRSGIADFTADARFDERFAADPAMPWSLEQTLQVILRNPPSFAPGAEVQYCDSNYALLGAIAARVDGASLAEVIARRVIEPAGLFDTYYPDDDAIRSPHPQGYVPEVTSAGAIDPTVPPTVVNEVNPAVPAGAGALISTLDDVAAWGDVLVDGRLLGPLTQARRLQTQRFEGQTLDFGYGLGITNFNEYLGHDGAIFGFSSVVLTRPETGTQIAMVGNTSTNSTTPTLSIAVALIDEIDPSQGPAAG
ncbi:serine hydrolase domain-containing protein [Herbiconiux flava]|uniref:D-alanyl-D-alanine carboxypeptidase n=1 Tax=Herbiconiux flava TaxID=881268 RepID=A0A852STU4_9MICO|nr:serine hydrolase domain-containing protein [Herbiconiux flava]NYD72074.1 D-alanyl-D-alanine carboxypeptidase [Herbiconiux flava]GLK17962.1 beta-lactamase [Herbiconiux flava]